MGDSDRGTTRLVNQRAQFGKLKGALSVLTATASG